MGGHFASPRVVVARVLTRSVVTLHYDVCGSANSEKFAPSWQPMIDSSNRGSGTRSAFIARMFFVTL